MNEKLLQRTLKRFTFFISVSAAKIVMRLLVVFACCYPKWSFNKGVVKTMLSYGSECEYNTVCIQIAISFSPCSMNNAKLASQVINSGV